jgi:hypothetical protein
MSTMQMALVWPLKMKPSPKAVLVSLADNANDEGVCWPSIPRISQRTCLGRTAVLDAIRWLEESLLLTVEHSPGGRSNRYTLTVARFLEAQQQPAQEQSASRTVREADGSPAGLSTVREADGSVRLPDPNHQEPSLNRHPQAMVATPKTGKAKKAIEPLADPPDWIPRASWDAFAEMRERIKKPMTQHAADLMARRLADLVADASPHTFENDTKLAAAILDQSTRNNWQDVYALKQEQQQRQPPRGMEVYSSRAPAQQQPSRMNATMATLQGMKRGGSRE